MPDYTLPCPIGQRAFLVEDHNKYHDKCDGYLTTYGSRIVITPFRVDAFIIDEDGVAIAEENHDGFNKLSVYHDLTLEKIQPAKIFFTIEEASEFVESVRDHNQSFDLGGTI